MNFGNVFRMSRFARGNVQNKNTFAMENLEKFKIAILDSNQVIVFKIV